QINLQVPSASIFGYLGANGAGKTTTIRMILNLQKPTEGTVSLFGRPQEAFGAIAPRIGVVPGEVRLYEDMTGLETLDYFQSFLEGPPLLRARLAEALKMSSSDLTKKVRAYSQGMKQKLLLIQAMQHDPDLLILDEPSERLDPLIQMRLYELLADFKSRGKTVFFSSHNLPEVERICDHIGIIKDGELIVQDEIETLKKKLPRTIRVTFRREMPAGELEKSGLNFTVLSPRQADLHIRGSFEEVWPRLCKMPLSNMDMPESPLESFFMDYYRNGTQGGMA
ncbi:MAG TPA: ABC transporter ATP-binding protein, partial [Caldithrix abyssi]|nr:ABC transporter ATP-binding protein [Caldithrix abyssi]